MGRPSYVIARTFRFRSRVPVMPYYIEAEIDKLRETAWAKEEGKALEQVRDLLRAGAVVRIMEAQPCWREETQRSEGNSPSE